MKRRLWYHCGPDRGPSFAVERRAPKSPDPKEPPTPRLCVCPAIPNCFAARLFDDGREVTIYRTAVRCRGVSPQNVWDAVITGERWMIPPMQMTRVGRIPSSLVDEATELCRAFHVETGQPSTIRLRICQLAIAWRVLGPDYGKRSRYWPTLCEKWCDTLGIADPEEYVLEAMG